MDNFNYRNSYVIVGKITSAGYAAGQVANPESVTPPTVSGALVLPTIIDSSGVSVTRSVYTERSGGVIRQNIDGGVESVTPVTVNFGRFSSALAALSSNVATANVDTVGTVGTIKHGGYDIAPEDLNNVFVGILHQASRYASGSFTAGVWTLKLYGNCQLSPNDYGTNQSTGENPFPAQWTATPSKTTKAPWGQLWSALSLGYGNNETFMHPMTSTYPLHIATAWVDGIVTTFTLPYLPLNSDAAITGRNIITKNGVRTAVTSVNTTTGVVTIASAGSSGDIWVVVYETNFVAT
jgi:hypothetical protein